MDRFCYKKINLAYFNKCKNFGDILNTNLLNYFKKDYDVVDFEKANLVAIGSILQSITTNKKPIDLDYFDSIDIWGSGFVEEKRSDSEYFIKNVKIHALRGNISRKRCENILNQKLDDIGIGDPGLLVSKIFPFKKNVRFDVGIIPHYVDKNNEYIKNIKLKNKKLTIIDIQDDPKNVCQKINECRVILSSAMHGLIASDSYGIPNKWIRFSDKITGGNYKFNDYYSAFNITEEPIDLRYKEICDNDIDNIEKNYLINKEDVGKISNDLIKKFPHKKIFSLPLNLIQNIHFATALSEFDKNILIPIKFKDIFDYLNKYFKYDISFSCEDSGFPVLRNISYNHSKPFIRKGNIEKPLVFPKQLVEFCEKKWPANKNGIIFSGLRTKKREFAIQKWINESTDLNLILEKEDEEFLGKNLKIKFTQKGRIFPEKSWDSEYYQELLSSQFVLCPDGDFVWTYRFFEAIICGSIPIIENHCKLYEGFYYYKMSEKIEKYEYSKEKTIKNLKLFKSKYCFDKNELKHQEKSELVYEKIKNFLRKLFKF